MLVFDLVGVFFVVNVRFDVLHGTGTIKGYARYDILYAVGFEVAHEALHAAALQLEHRVSIALAYHPVHFGIVVLHRVEVYLSARILLDEIHRLFDIRKVHQTQKVHLEQAELLDLYHVVLAGDDALTVHGEGRVFGNGIAADDDARGMKTRLTGHAFQLDRDVYDLTEHTV